MSGVRVELAGNRILLASERPLPGLKNAVPGAYFRKDGTWSLPLDLETCRILRERFAKRLVIGPKLWDWAKEEKAGRERAGQTAIAMDATLKVLPEVAPTLHMAMENRRYQRAAVRFVADAIGRDGTRRALIGDTVGLGKTAEALGAVLETEIPGPYLIVCPKGAVTKAWTPEIKRWLPGDEIITLPEGYAKRSEVLRSLIRRTRTTLGGAERTSLARTWVVVHPASIRTQTVWICGECASETPYKAGIVNTLDCGDQKDARTKVHHKHTFPDLFRVEWGAVIVDESDQVLIRKSATPNLQRRGAEMLRDLVRPGGVRLAMSGTPFRSKPHQIWSTLNWLDPIRWSSKWNWLGRYWNVNTSGYGGSYSIGEFIEEREEMLRQELVDVMIRRTRDEVRSDLPAKLYGGTPLVPGDETSPVGVWLELTPKQRLAYDAMEKSARADLDGGTLNAIGVLAELTRLKQFAGAIGALNRDAQFVPLAEGNKYEWIVEFLQGQGLPDKPSTKIVIASQFTQMLNAFAAGVSKEFRGMKTALITGEVSMARRDAAIDEFEDPDSDLNVIFLNTKAGGSAITLDAAEIMIVCDETWVDDEQEQLEGRIDNRQPERRIVPRTYYYLRSLGTVEESIAAANAAAKRAGKRILDGDRIKAVKEGMKR